MARNHRSSAASVAVGDRVYLAGVGHLTENQGVVGRFWANGWVEVHFPGWTWVGEAAGIERCEGHLGP